jgi:hypothetical protein
MLGSVGPNGKEPSRLRRGGGHGVRVRARDHVHVHAPAASDQRAERVAVAQPRAAVAAVVILQEVAARERVSHGDSLQPAQAPSR